MSDIDENEIQVFVDAVRQYFDQITGESATLQSAYLGERESPPPTFDFTGLITISGAFTGCIYFSAPKQMVRKVLTAQGEPDHSEATMLDATGEVANTIAGNARRHFGQQLEISVPVTLQGNARDLSSTIRSHPHIIMVGWKRLDASLIVDITRTEEPSAVG